MVTKAISRRNIFKIGSYMTFFVKLYVEFQLFKAFRRTKILLILKIIKEYTCYFLYLIGNRSR